MSTIAEYALSTQLGLQNRLIRTIETTREATTGFRWVWLVLIGILVVAAAVAFIYCRNSGYGGFNGRIEAIRGPWGVKIGIKLGCY